MGIRYFTGSRGGVSVLDIIKRTWAEINLDAVKDNFIEIRSHVGDAKICCVVKADGYGHGANKLAELYSSLGADCFAVSNIDEATELRISGIEEPIIILGYTPPVLCSRLAKHRLTQAVYGADYAELLSAQCVADNVEIDIHIKIDTGMSRIGFMCQSFPRDNSSIDEIVGACRLPGLNAGGIMAHFCVADEGEAGREYTEGQLAAIRHTVDELSRRGVNLEVVHHANSAATECYPQSLLSMVRAGIILYGLSPSPELSGRFSIRPAMTLKTTVAYVKKLYKDSSVSYGRTFVADRDMTVATVTIGYADGYFRSLSKDGYMTVRGKKAKILGRVCMDQTIIDVTGIDGVEIGDEVTVFSDGSNNTPTADDLAGWANTINYEIICAVSKRVPRVYIKDGKTVDVMYKL